MSIPFNRDYSVDYGVIEELGPSLRRMTAPNPSSFTFHGTSTYVVGRGDVMIVDPGPPIAEHVDALVNALKDETVTHVLVTHTHQDHSPACSLLKHYIDAPTVGFGPHAAGIDLLGLEPDEGGDMDFVPDIVVADGDRVEGSGWFMECVHTPGHTSNHLGFAHSTENFLLCGDHVMGWSTSIISPPDGHMGDYMNSLSKLLERNDEIYWPAHGDCIKNPKPFVRAFIEHRQQREQQVFGCIQSGRQTIAEMLPVVYADLDKSLYPAAARSIFATVIFLVEKGMLFHHGALTIDSEYLSG